MPKKLPLLLFCFSISILINSCASHQYGPATTFEFSNPADSPPVYLSVLMTAKEYESPATEMTGLQKNDIAYAIMQNWMVEEELKGSADPYRTLVELTVVRDGVIKNKTIVETSGSRLFDESVVNAIEAAAPFPAFPVNMEEKVIIVRIVFSNKKL